MKITQQNLKKLGLKTGDLILFAGQEKFSDAIKYLTGSQWSHVGMVLKNQFGELLFFESTKGKYGNGVLLNHLDKVLNAYEGRFAFRKLKNPLTNWQLKILNAFIPKYLHRPYEKNYPELFCALLKCNPRKNLATLFCSELIAEIYQQCQIISGKTSSNNFTPADFSSASRYSIFRGTELLEREYEIPKEQPQLSCPLSFYYTNKVKPFPGKNPCYYYALVNSSSTDHYPFPRNTKNLAKEYERSKKKFTQNSYFKFLT